MGQIKNTQFHLVTEFKICEELLDHCLAPDCQMGGLGCDNMTVILVCLLNEQSYEDLAEKCSSTPQKEVLENYNLQNAENSDNDNKQNDIEERSQDNEENEEQKEKMEDDIDLT